VFFKGCLNDSDCPGPYQYCKNGEHVYPVCGCKPGFYQDQDPYVTQDNQKCLPIPSDI